MAIDRSAPRNTETPMRKRAGLLRPLLLLAAGFYLGAVVDAAFRPNRITLGVDAISTRINVVPQPGDKIHWIDEKATADGNRPDVGIQFGDVSPCQEYVGDTQPTSNCTIRERSKLNPAQGVYHYRCKTISCADPGLNPTSGTNGGALALRLANTPILAPLQDLFFLFDRVTGKSESTDKLTPPPTKIGPQPPLTTPVDIPVKCAKGAPLVNLGEKVSARKNDMLIWEIPAGYKLTVTLPPGFCTEQPSSTLQSTGNVAICTVNADLADNVRYPIVLNPPQGDPTVCSAPQTDETNNVLYKP